MRGWIALVPTFIAAALLPVVLVLSHRNTVLVLAVLSLGGAAALSRVRVPRWGWPLLALAAWASLSTLWSPSAEDRDWWLRVPLFVLVLTGTCLAARRGGRTEGRLFAAAALIGVAALGVEAVTGGLIRDLVPPDAPPDRDDVASARGVGLGLLLLPAAACLTPSRWRAAAALGGAALLGLGVWRFGVAAHGVALCAGTAAALCAARAPGGTLRGALCLLAAAFVLVPLASLFLPPPQEIEAMTAGPLSWRQRLLAWRLVAEAGTQTAAGFLFGAGHHGAEALGEALEAAEGAVTFPGSGVAIPRLPGHPHNLFLQVWYELGALGAALAATGLALAARAVSATALPRPLPEAIAATLAVGGVLALVDANLWTLWRLAGAGLAAYGLILAAGVLPERRC